MRTPKGGAPIQFALEMKTFSSHENVERKEGRLKFLKVKNSVSLIFASLEYSLPYVFTVFICYFGTKILTI